MEASKKQKKDLKDETPEEPKEMMNDLEQMGVEIQKIRDLAKQLKKKLR